MNQMDAKTFARWWQYRDLPNDRKVVGDVIAAGLAVNAGGLLCLTEAGKALRQEGDAPRKSETYPCKVCGAPIQSVELCEGCACGNDPFQAAKRSGDYRR